MTPPSTPASFGCTPAITQSGGDRRNPVTMTMRLTATLRAGLATGLLVLAAGCATLPQSGPTGGRVINAGKSGAFILRRVTTAADLPPAPTTPQFTPLPAGFTPGASVLAPGDVITVVYYEVGARLFSSANPANGTFDANAKGTTIPNVPIDEDGRVRLPYTGVIEAAGKTPRQLAEAIEASLRNKSENPQVLVQLNAANGSSVMISGEIARTGRVPLSAAREKLLDVISLAGGPRGAPETLLVHVDRRGVSSDGPLDRLTYQNFGGTTMEPGDRIQLVRQPWTYTVMGSAARINRFDLPLRGLSLVEALALAGGPGDAIANPAAVFVFRFDEAAPAGSASPPATARPTVYHVNMMRPASYLLAQHFYLTDKDVIYVASAEANQPNKLLQILGQIVGPVAIARQITQ